MIADGNDQPIGFVELVLDPALWVNQIAAIAGCAAALYDVNHRRFTYQQTPELFGKLEPILLPEDSTRPAVTAQIGDSHYLSTCLPLRSPDGGLVSTLWLTRDNTVQANSQRRNLLIGSALLVEGINGKVQGGLKNVRDTAGEFQEVVCGSRKLAELISGIAASSAQQAQGIDQINTAVSRIEQVTQKNATEAESSAAVATEMDAEAGRMNAFMELLAAIVNGSRDGEPTRDAARKPIVRRSRSAEHAAAAGPAEGKHRLSQLPV